MNCFLKGNKAETVRKPKHVSGSISKVVYQDENDEDHEDDDNDNDDKDDDALICPNMM